MPATGQPLICGNGEMAHRIREKDWSQTPLGPLDQWSDSLVATVNLALASSETFAIYWGSEQILLYNDRYRALLHGKHPSALGKSGPQVWGEAWDLIGPQIEKAYAGDTTVVDEAMIPTLVDGPMRNGWYSYSLHPIYEHGRIVAVGNPGREITAQVEARMSLNKVAAELTQVLDATTDCVVGIDRNWKISYLNPAAEKTYGPGSELLGHSSWEKFPASAQEGSPFREHYGRAMNEGVSGSFETHYPEPLNLWLRLDVYPTPNGIVIFSRDVTERRLAQAALVQSEKLAVVGRLASSIAHEINNPLEAVTNLLYLALDSQDVSEIHAYLTTAETELRRTSSIASQTLRFHKQSTRPMEVTCDDLIGNILSVHRARIVNAHVEVQKRKRAHTPVLCFDGEIRQVLSNLVGNAIDSMKGTGGRLLMRSREATDWRTGRRGLVLTVADTGTGMSPATVAKIFGAFYTTKGIGGTGLGLWISKEIIDRHRGRILVRSSQGSHHHGTVFSLFLPFDAANR